MNIISRWKSRRIIDYLKNSSSEEISKGGAKGLIPAFQRAAENVPAYKRLLKEKGVAAGEIKDIGRFKRLAPIIDKKIFGNNAIKELCVNGTIEKMKQAAVSSGFSDKFSYSLSGKKELKNLSFLCDTLLDHAFNISKKKTFLINSLAMGVKVYTSLPLAETSVRSDVTIALIKELAPEFDQIILIGNPYFLKKVIEEGIEKEIGWESKIIHLVMGEDWFPENFRSYLANLMDVDFNNPEKGMILSSMGICELGLSLFQESIDTYRIRLLAQEDERLKFALFGKDAGFCPILFHYNPYQIFLEEVDGDLIFTRLSRDSMIPLIRYNSKDKGRIYPYNQLREILSKFGYESYLPQLKLPLVSVSGRKDKYIALDDFLVFPEEIKEALYYNFEVASSITGYFRLNKHGNVLRLEIQLKKGRQAASGLKEKIKEVIAMYIKVNFELSVYSYEDFPYGLELTYEKKFSYI